MASFNQLLLVLHFIGLGMGLSVSFGNIVVLGLIGSAGPSEKPVLARFPPAISKVGQIGLALLWITGATMAYTKWNGIGSMPWTFQPCLLKYPTTSDPIRPDEPVTINVFMLKP